jgi:hypothetical protein
VIRKASLFVTAVAIGALAASQWPDIKRYVKIKQLSAGQGHPENVPAKGRTAYPQRTGDAR